MKLMKVSKFLPKGLMGKKLVYLGAIILFFVVVYAYFFKRREGFYLTGAGKINFSNKICPINKTDTSNGGCDCSNDGYSCAGNGSTTGCEACWKDNVGPIGVGTSSTTPSTASASTSTSVSAETQQPTIKILNYRHVNSKICRPAQYWSDTYGINIRTISKNKNYKECSEVDYGNTTTSRDKYAKDWNMTKYK